MSTDLINSTGFDANVRGYVQPIDTPLDASKVCTKSTYFTTLVKQGKPLKRFYFVVEGKGTYLRARVFWGFLNSNSFQTINKEMQRWLVITLATHSK